ncbi:MAG: hypothetical protein HYT43_01780 [Candidatus Taylorbacteria bacterium]|nr:hypothetical protein [Candidatus Taylorbacteria bacterium]
MLHNALVLAETFLFLYFAFLTGAVLLPRLGLKDIRGVIYVTRSVLLGLGALALAGFVLGIFGLFKSGLLWIVVAVFLALSLNRIRRHASFLSARGVSSLWEKIQSALKGDSFLKILVLIWLAANFTLNFVPITAHDTKDYHLPIIQDIVSKGKIDFTETIEHYRFSPVLAETMYAIPAALFGEKNAPFVFQSLQYMTLPLFLGLVYDFLRRRIKNSFLIPVALLAIMGIMDFQREVLHGGYVDTFAFVYGFAATLPFIDYATAKRGSDFPALAFSAVMLGISLGMKYFGFFFGFLNFIFLAVAWRRFKLPARHFSKMLLKFSLIVAVIGVFWYGKNFVYYHNPFYPMFSNDPAVEITKKGISSYLIERNIQNFALFPFALFGQRFVDENESSSRLVALAYFALLYVFIFLKLIFRRKFSLNEILLFIFIEGYLAFHFALSHYIRYLLPPVIILPALLALLGDSLYNHFQTKLSNKRFRLFGYFTKIVCSAALVFLFLGNFHYFKIRFFHIIGKYNQEEYIRKIGSQ